MGVYLICYAASYLYARSGHYYLSGLVLLGAAVYLYWYDYKKSGNIIHLRGIFSLFWVGGEGISCLKLSHLQGNWSFITWLCFLFALIGFWFTFEGFNRVAGETRHIPSRWNGYALQQKQIYRAIVAITVISLLSFVFEAFTLGYVPLLLQGVPHAYSEFHISGVHYFTVSCVLVPSLSVLYYMTERRREGGNGKVVAVLNVIALLIPILCVSRFQLILAVTMAVFTYIAFRGKFSFTLAAGMIAVLIPIYLLLTVARSHDIAYLNGIFEMKNSKMPIFITQPYMYVANNYDNFNCLVGHLSKHSFGMRSLFPLWALSGLKFLIPSLVHYPIIVNKEELTTLTLFYDAYYDFGMVGVALFSCLLGGIAYFLTDHLSRMKNCIGYLFYAQISVYFMLSFFTTWFSNPTTWFYLIVTGIIFLYCSRKN